MNKVDYSFGESSDHDHDRNRTGDKRGEYRLAGSASVVLELESGEPDETGQGGTGAQTQQCRIRDLSARGLCLVTSQPVAVGALLPAFVTLVKGQDTYTLMVEVIWCRSDDDRWLIGAEIQDSDETSYVDWVEAVARVMTED